MNLSASFFIYSNTEISVLWRRSKSNIQNVFAPVNYLHSSHRDNEFDEVLSVMTNV